MNDRKEKFSKRAAMKENGLIMSVSSREKTYTKGLVRATTESKSRTQTVTNGHVGQMGDE